MKVLILDHHFRQDIDALARVSAAEDVIRIVSADIFASRAHDVFPAAVFNADMARYHAPEMARQRATYRKLARELMSELYLTFPFDVLVLPSDTFLYIRDVVDIVREWGISTVVVQKESGVSAKSLEHHAREMRRWFPFASDVMTVCSQKSKEFWVASGARPDQVSILGQPRFDVYHSGADAADLRTFGVELSAGRPVLLFLSYDLDAYAEERSLGTAHRPWEQLHHETERVLLALAAEGVYTLVIKPHPQQDSSQLDRLLDRVASIPNTFVLPPEVDTRSLLLSVDVVIGFQTTAMAEAMIAGKRVVYTFWTDYVQRVHGLLLPFHEMADAIDVATSAEDLHSRLTTDTFALSPEVRAKRREYCEPYLGVVDGVASARVWALIRDEADRHGRLNSVATMRLRAVSPAYCQKEATRAARRAANWSALATGTALIPGFGQMATRAIRRRDRETMRIQECRERMSDRYRKIAALQGPGRDGMFGAGWRWLMRRIGAGADARAMTNYARQC